MSFQEESDFALMASLKLKVASFAQKVDRFVARHFFLEEKRL